MSLSYCSPVRSTGQISLMLGGVMVGTAEGKGSVGVHMSLSE